MARWLFYGVMSVLILAFLGIGAMFYVFYEYGRGLPDFRQLATYKPPVTTRLYAGDGRLLAEYAAQKRVFVPYESIPPRVVHAFIAAEDQNFFRHPGVDPFGIMRAAIQNLRNYGKDVRPVGASSITQQVAKNFLLTNEVSIERKIREAILALRIESAFTKEHILELYLNEIFLGQRSYGVAAAALNYFNKTLEELTLAETAYLAGLPKAPNNYHPIEDRERAIGRRSYVLGRMFEDGYINAQEKRLAEAAPLVMAAPRPEERVASGAYFAEEVRREIADRYGTDALYEGGLAVRTTVSPRLQAMAAEALTEGLIAYDRRHGWRGPVTSIANEAGEVPGIWPSLLEAVEAPPVMPPAWTLAVVLELDAERARLGLHGGRFGQILMADMAWARPWLEGQRVGPAPETPADVLRPGDVVMVEARYDPDADPPLPTDAYALRQVPDVDGAIVALDPHTGRVLAMVGGFSQRRSEFNRATQARRQPGSAFKPFVYLTAMEEGYTPSSLVLDAPFVLDQGPGQGKWKPTNYSDKFYGPSTLRWGIEKSRNVMTVRLADAIGMDRIAETARRFGAVDDIPEVLSMALGAGETTLLQLTTAYAKLVNGGKAVAPRLIDRIQDREGQTVYRHDDRRCDGCRQVAWAGGAPPTIADQRAQLADPISVYQVVHMLEGVVQRGTGRQIAEIGKPLAGKTGTTNDNVDTWFIGFSPDLVAGVFVGFDDPRTLGPRDTGSTVAAPIFKGFMERALKDAPATPFRVPDGVRFIRVSHKTGLPPKPGEGGLIIREAFKPDQSPYDKSLAADTSSGPVPTGLIAAPASPAAEAGGLY